MGCPAHRRLKKRLLDQNSLTEVSLMHWCRRDHLQRRPCRSNTLPQPPYAVCSPHTCALSPNFPSLPPSAAPRPMRHIWEQVLCTDLGTPACHTHTVLSCKTMHIPCTNGIRRDSSSAARGRQMRVGVGPGTPVDTSAAASTPAATPASPSVAGYCLAQEGDMSQHAAETQT
jgi:hypothetical protein